MTTRKTKPKPKGREVQPHGGADVCGVRVETLSDAELDALLSAVIAEQGRRLDPFINEMQAVDLDLPVIDGGLLE